MKSKNHKAEAVFLIILALALAVLYFGVSMKYN